MYCHTFKWTRIGRNHVFKLLCFSSFKAHPKSKAWVLWHVWKAWNSNPVIFLWLNTRVKFQDTGNVGFYLKSNYYYPNAKAFCSLTFTVHPAWRSTKYCFPQQYLAKGTLHLWKNSSSKLFLIPSFLSWDSCILNSNVCFYFQVRTS